MSKSLQLMLLLLFFTPIACDNAAKKSSSEKNSGESKVVSIDPNLIQPGPILRDRLSDEQMARVTALQAIFGKYDGKTLEQWVDDFKRDTNPDKELQIWERMAKAFNAYCSGKKISIEAKKDVYVVLLHRSMAPENEVLKRMKLKVLSREEAIAVMKGY